MTVTLTIFTEFLKTCNASVGVCGQNIYLLLDTCVTHLQDVSFLWYKCFVSNIMGEHHSSPDASTVCDQSFGNPFCSSIHRVTKFQTGWPRSLETNTELLTHQCQQCMLFPGSHPSKFWKCSRLINFANWSETSIVKLAQTLARKEKVVYFPHTVQACYNCWIWAS